MTCQHGLPVVGECDDCPRLVFDLDRLTAALEGLDRRTIRDLSAGEGTWGHDLARTVAGDVFDKAEGIVR